MASDVPRQYCDYVSLPSDWRLRPDEVHLFAFPLDAPRADIERLARSLSPQELVQRKRFAFAHLSDRYAVAHGTMRDLLGRCLGGAGHALRIETAAGGKPFLPDHPTLRFNLSHSADMGLLGVVLNHPIGVDIEAVRPMQDRDAIAARFFAASECAALSALPADERTAGFFRCWTRKEAYVKALGTGLATPLDSFQVALDPPGGFVSSGTESRWMLRDVSPSTTFTAAACTPNIALSWHCWCLAPVHDEASPGGAHRP